MVLAQASPVEVAGRGFVVHHAEDPGSGSAVVSLLMLRRGDAHTGGGGLSPQVGHLSADLLQKNRQVVEPVLVDAERGDAGKVGQPDVRRVAVPVQDQRVEPLQLAQQSRVPVGAE